MRRKKEKHTDFYKSVMKIIKTYDSSYQRTFAFWDFDNPTAVREVALELQENEFATINYKKQQFTVKVSGIRYLKQLVNKDFSIEREIKFPLCSLFVTLLALLVDAIIRLTELNFQNNPYWCCFIIAFLFGGICAILKSL